MAVSEINLSTDRTSLRSHGRPASESLGDDKATRPAAAATLGADKSQHIVTSIFGCIFALYAIPCILLAISCFLSSELHLLSRQISRMPSPRSAAVEIVPRARRNGNRRQHHSRLRAKFSDASMARRNAQNGPGSARSHGCAPPPRPPPRRCCENSIALASIRAQAPRRGCTFTSSSPPSDTARRCGRPDFIPA
jgi:hypothetical protein